MLHFAEACKREAGLTKGMLELAALLQELDLKQVDRFLNTNSKSAALRMLVGKGLRCALNTVLRVLRDADVGEDGDSNDKDDGYSDKDNDDNNDNDNDE